MKYGILTLDDFDVADKTVLCRVDINQPVDKVNKKLKDTTRIKACVPTLSELQQKGAKLVLLAHQGSDIEYKNYYTLEYHAQYLQEYMGVQVKFIDDVTGPAARDAIRALQSGEVLLLDNVRFVAEEMTLFELKLNLTFEQMAQTECVRKLAPLADLYVCDAFAASHRAQPTLCGFQMVLPSCMGRLFEEEYSVVSGVMEAPQRPCVFVLGGAKIDDAFAMMRTVLQNGIADSVIAGGVVANVLLESANKSIGKASYEFLRRNNSLDHIETGRQLLADFKDKIEIPQDLACVIDGVRHEHSVDELQDEHGYIDIGHETAKRFSEILMGAKTIFINGPMGIFEEEISEYGSRAVWEASANSEGFTVLGGGDSITATKKFGLTDRMGFVCTGGGALIRFLTGEEVPVVKALRMAAKRDARPGDRAADV
ncbi:MAG: phosphoglycerate kinase [Christensenellales bacterium]|jgi:phosphoglycerate kinase